jgi:hypothetical protein
MSNRPKYVTFTMTGRDRQFIIFDQWNAHDATLRHIDHCLESGIEVKAISAGFVEFNEDKATGKLTVDTFGESYTLGIGSKEGDSELLQATIENGMECTFFGNERKVSFLASSLSFEDLECFFEYNKFYFQGTINLSGRGQELSIKSMQAFDENPLDQRETKFLNCLKHSY